MKKRLLLAALLTSLQPAWLCAAADPPATSLALRLKPVQKDVQYESPSSADAEKATVEAYKSGKATGWVVLGADGRHLRRFLDTNGDGSTDLWCYYNDGVEVYRDIDADYDGKADQYRWLGTAGTRWGLDSDEDGQIDQWKQISAEEISAELVAAIAQADAKRFERLLISSEELDKLALGAEFSEKIATKRRQAARDFSRFAKEQTTVDENARWLHFAASQPGVIPTGTAGSEQDVTVYENAVAMFESQGKTGQLLVGTIVQIGDGWRLIDLPQDPSTDPSLAGFFFSGATLAQGSTPNAPEMDKNLQQFVSELEKIDEKIPSASGSALAKLHDQRADCLEGIIASCAPEHRASWVRQLVDTVGAAVQENAYPAGVQRLETLSKKLGANNQQLQAYVDFQLISCDYAQRLTNVSNQADFPKVQEWWLTSLEKFVNEHPKTPEAAQAMLQLGLNKEFEDNEKEAISWYTRVATQFRGTDVGRKAEGAVNRLESVGREIKLVGKQLENGKPFNIAELRGKPVVVHYWATWCEPCKQDMKLLARLQARYQRAGLQIVGINVDGSRDDARRFLNETRYPWVNLFDEGGLDSSPLANALGVQTLPTMLLVDQSGKVVRHNITASQLDAELEKLVR